MQFDIFAPDFGILPSEYFKKSAITNPIELFWSDDLAALLRLCGEREETVEERASDFDRFLSLCRALPLLQGHPTRAWVTEVLKNHFALQELPTKETAPAIWQTLCEHLLINPIIPADLVSGAWLSDGKTVPQCLPKGVTPVLHANLLLDTTAKTLADWVDELRKTVFHFTANGCQKIFLRLPDDFQFTIPSVFHVNRALSLTKRDREATNLLLAQLTREICTALQESDLLLVLACNGASLELTRLLQYVEDAVGLPRIVWSVQRIGEAAPLLSFSAKPHKNEIFAALQYESVMTNVELFTVLDAWQVRYPAGRLCYLTARDLRQTASAQTHIINMLQERKQKI